MQVISSASGAGDSIGCNKRDPLLFVLKQGPFWVTLSVTAFYPWHMRAFLAVRGVDMFVHARRQAQP